MWVMREWMEPLDHPAITQVVEQHSKAEHEAIPAQRDDAQRSEDRAD